MKRDIDDMSDLVNAAKDIHLSAIKAITYVEPSDRSPKIPTPVSKKAAPMFSAHKVSSSTISKPPSQLSTIKPKESTMKIPKRNFGHPPLPDPHRKKHSLSVMERQGD
jgi:hypothetical protein